MSTDRFDTISKLFGQRLSRRSALRGTGAGLAGAALASTAAVAQGATPVASTPATGPTDPHPSAGDMQETEYLFVQAFERGTWAPKDGEEEIYTLTLTGASAQTIYFSDRPERIFGVTPMQQFLDTLGFEPTNPPNAALVAPIADSGEEEILIIELLNPQYDASTATLTYDAKVLADYHEDGLSHAATRQQDYAFAQTFDRGGLFIDDCPANTHDCINKLNGNNEGSVCVGGCWQGLASGCEECRSPEDYCRLRYNHCEYWQVDEVGVYRRTGVSKCRGEWQPLDLC